MKIGTSKFSKEAGIRIKYAIYSSESYYELYFFDEEAYYGDRGENYFTEDELSSTSNIFSSVSPQELNVIQFVHNGEVREMKFLSKVEVKLLLTGLAKLPLFVRFELLTSVCVDPVVHSSLELETNILKASFSWSNEQEISGEKQFKKLNDFCQLIEDLIDVDFNGIEFPVII